MSGKELPASDIAFGGYNPDAALVAGELYGVRSWHLRPDLPGFRDQDGVIKLAYNEDPTTAQPARAFKDIATGYAKGRLRSISYGHDWNDKVTATCRRRGGLWNAVNEDYDIPAEHTAPHAGCTCGLYGWYTPWTAINHHTGTVLGIVKFSGHTVMGTAGFRAEHGELVAICPNPLRRTLRMPVLIRTVYEGWFGDPHRDLYSQGRLYSMSLRANDHSTPMVDVEQLFDYAGTIDIDMLRQIGALHHPSVQVFSNLFEMTHAYSDRIAETVGTARTLIGEDPAETTLGQGEDVARLYSLYAGMGAEQRAYLDLHIHDVPMVEWWEQIPFAAGREHHLTDTQVKIMKDMADQFRATINATINWRTP